MESLAVKPLTVLLADDSDDFRENLSEFLKSQPGIEIVGDACGGLETLYKANSLHPDVILLDISMSGISGFEVAQLLKEYLPATMIVFLTVHEEPAYMTLAETVGADGFVCKRSVKEELPLALQRIRQGIRKHVFNSSSMTATTWYFGELDNNM